MADTKISALTSATTPLVGTEEIPAVQGGATKKTTVDDIREGRVEQTDATGSAVMPTGTTAQRDGTPTAGYTRFNSTLGRNETYNGSAWEQEVEQSDGYVLNAITYLTTGTAATYTTPTGARALYVEVVGGGGGGGGVNGTGAGAGGGAGGGSGGGYAAKLITSPAASYTYTVGAGGAAGASGDNTGGTGGTSSFGALSATGGGGGSGIATSASNAFYGSSSGGVGSGGDINISGTPGGGRTRGDFVLYAGGNGGNSPLGSGARGDSAANSAASGIAATDYGAGGSGAMAEDTTSNAAGGAGYQGVIRVKVYF